MPTKIVDKDGVEHEVYTPEEVKPLQEKADKVEGLEKEKLDLEGQVNPNWRNMREVNDKLRDGLKKAGKQVDEQGNIIETPVSITSEQISAQATASAQQVILDDFRDTQLAQYTPEQRAIIEVTYKKLAAGEALNKEKISGLIKQAANAHFPAATRTRSAGPTGSSPVMAGESGQTTDFAETAEGESVAGKLGLKFVKAKK